MKETEQEIFDRVFCRTIEECMRKEARWLPIKIALVMVAAFFAGPLLVLGCEAFGRWLGNVL